MREIRQKGGKPDPAERGGLSLRLRQIRLSDIAPVVVMVVIVLALFALAPQMLSARGLRSYAIDAAPVMILILASTLPILMGGIDLSVASMATFAGVGIALLAPMLGSASIPVMLAIAVMIGAGHGFLRAKLQLPSFIISLGFLGILSGLSLLLSNATALPIDSSLSFLTFLAGRWLGIPISVFVVVVLAIVLLGLMRLTTLGRAVYAIGSNERTAVLSAVGVVATYACAYAISGFCAALAGVILVSQTFYSAPDFANNLLLPAIVGVLLGGTSISGGIGGIQHSIVGGITTTVIRVGAIVLGFSPAYQNVVFGAVVILAVAASVDRRSAQIVK